MLSPFSTPKSLRWAVVTGLVLVLSACGGGGGGGGGGSSSPDSSPTVQKGVFHDSAVSNIAYRTSSQSGFTDSNGEFSYLSGERVIFSIGDIDLPEIAAGAFVTPLQMGVGGSLNSTVVNILRLLQSLDSDGDPDNGIEISDQAHDMAAGMVIQFDDPGFDSAVQALVANSGSVTVSLLDEQAAVAHFEQSLLSEKKARAPWFPVNTEARYYYNTSQPVYFTGNKRIGSTNVTPLLHPTGAKEYFSYVGESLRYLGFYSPSVWVSGAGYYSIDLTLNSPLAVFNSSWQPGLVKSVSGRGNVFISPTYGSKPVSYSGSVTYHGPETVNLAIGSVQAQHISYNLTMTATVEGTSFSIPVATNLWLARGIGVVRRTEFSSNFFLRDVKTSTGVSVPVVSGSPIYSGNTLDGDADLDGYIDVVDAFPLDSSEWLDTDSDGIGNNTDDDDDNDGYKDVVDIAPLDSTEPANSIDSDNDGTPDLLDSDDDNDGVDDINDLFPLDPAEWADADLDGIGDNADTDDDNDGVADTVDDFPTDPSIAVATTTINIRVIGNGYGEYDGLYNPVECASSCSFQYDNVNLSDIRLIATAGAHFTFAGWSTAYGCSSSYANECVLDLGFVDTIDITIEFIEDPHHEFNFHSSTSGSILGRFGEMQCHGDCSQNVYPGQFSTVEFIPVARPGYEFTGWSGDCTGTGSCQIAYALDATTTITANFTQSAQSFDLCPALSDGTAAQVGATGADTVGATGDILPLCNGHMILTELVSNKVYVRDVISGVTLREYQLASRPERMALDEENKLLYVTHGSAFYVSRVDLVTGAVTQLYALYNATSTDSVAVSNQGQLFIKAGSVLVVDSATGILEDTAQLVGGRLVYNDATDRLITLSYNYFFDHTSKNFVMEGRSVGGGSGSDCNYVVVSPDGNHAARPCGGGNGAGYTIYDFYSHDPTVIFGEWITGAYPSGAAFSPSSHYALLTNRSAIQLFTVQTHQLVLSQPEPYCGYNDTRKLAVSTDGYFLFALTNCGFNDDSAIVTWIYYDTTTP